MTKQKFSFDVSFFDEINTPEKAYWLGFIYADGFHNKYHFQMKLSIKDRDHLMSLRSALKSNHVVHNNLDTTFLRICSKQLCDTLDKLGCITKKSLVIRYPNIDPLLNKHFIRGVFDGDGCFYQGNDPTFSIVSGSYKFLFRIRQILRLETDIKAPIYEREFVNKLYTIQIRKQQDLQKLFVWLYDGSICLPRKHQKFRNYLQLKDKQKTVKKVLIQNIKSDAAYMTQRDR